MALFVLGHVVCTKGVNDALAYNVSFAEFVTGCLKRHTAGDWGDLDDEDQRANFYALDKCLRLFSAYNYRNNKKIWIISEADRSATTILFPDEY